MAFKHRYSDGWYKNANGIYVQSEPVGTSIMSGAATGDVLCVASDDTVEAKTITAGTDITVTQGAGTITIASTASGGGGGAVAVQTVVASASDAHTTDNTWEDIKDQALSGALQVTITASAAGILLCHLTIEVRSTNGGNWDHKGFRFVLDGATNSETWSEFRNNAVSDTSQVWLLSMHTVFSGVSAGSHTVKAQCWDRGSSQNLTFTERRLTVLAP